jgi:hypothetical protein
VSGTDDSGWAFVESYAPADPVPPNAWNRYTNEIVQVKLDGSEVRRLAHHRSRPFNSYTWTPRVSASRDGSKIVYASNYGLQAILGYPSEYSDAYMIDLGSSGSDGSTAPPSTPAPSTPSTPTTPTPTVPPVQPAPAPAPSPGSTTRIEQNGTGVSYTGTWHNNSYGFHSASGAVLSTNPGDRANLAFNGTGVTFIAYKDPWSGIARVYVDGSLKGEIDSYASPAKPQAAAYSISDLTPGNHNLTIEVTGRRNGGSGGSWVWVDAFDVIAGNSSAGSPPSTPTPPPSTPTPPLTSSSLRVEDRSSTVAYSGLWHPNTYSVHSQRTAKLSMTAGARATLTFTGTSASWIAYRDAWSGIARVYVDGNLQGEIDTYVSAAKAQAVMHTVSGLAWGQHTLAIEATGRRNPSSQGSWIWVDAFDYMGAVATGSSIQEGPGNEVLAGSAEVKSALGQSAPSGIAILEYSHNGVMVSETGVSASSALVKGRIYNESSASVKTGIVLTNPNDTEASVSFFLTDETGADSGAGSLTLPPRGQIARFLDESPFNAAGPTGGTFSFRSNIPVSAATLRGITNERNEFLIDAMPVINSDKPAPTNPFFPHFAEGGGWKTQFVLVNPSDTAIAGTLSFQEQGTSGSGARPLSLNIDGTMVTSIQYSIPPRSSRRYSTSGTGSAIRAGSAQVVAAASNATPVGMAIFSFKEGPVTVSEAAIAAIEASTGFRMYAEANDDEATQTGIAVRNASETDQRVVFELIKLDGTPTQFRGTITLPGNGQRVLFLSQIPGFESLAKPFAGVLRVSSGDGGNIAVAGLRSRVNERGEFLLSATPPTSENATAEAKVFFPYVVNGNGYTTDFILYSGTSSQAATGSVQVFSQSGAALSLDLFR